jgi:hypothetical protein
MNINSSDNSVETLRKLGNEKFRSLNYGAALMHYTQAIDKNPENFALYYNRAVTFVKMDNIDEAKEDLLKSLEINPRYIPSLCQLGFIYLYQGNTPDSLESYVRIVEINESLPNQLSRFKAQLKEAIRLAESRCKQQEYPQEFIDNIITPEIRSILDSYPNLPTHMVESGIPPVSFGNVPISHHGSNQNTAIIARGSIPISLSNLTNINNNDRNNNSNNTTQSQTQPSEPTNTVNEAISRALNISGLANVLNTPGVSASVSVAGSQNPQDLMNVLGNLTNTSLNSANTIVTPAGASSNTGTDANISNNNANNNPSHNSPVIINPLSLRSSTNPTTTGLSSALLQQHQAAHEAALNRAAELRRQREQERGVPATGINASSSVSATTTSPPSPLPTPLEATASTSTTTTTATAAAASSATTPISPNATTTADFAQHFANTIATQLNNAAAQNSNNVGPNATPNSTAIQSLTQNLTSIASGVLGGLATGSNFVSMVTNSGNNNNNSGYNNNNERPLDADLDMDLD